MAILSTNRAEHIMIDLAIAMTGLIKVPINTKLHPRETEYILNDSNAKLLLGEKHLTDKINYDGKVVTFEDPFTTFIKIQILNILIFLFLKVTLCNYVHFWNNRKTQRCCVIPSSDGSICAVSNDGM